MVKQYSGAATKWEFIGIKMDLFPATTQNNKTHTIGIILILAWQEETLKEEPKRLQMSI